ncbi:hypothetical protein DICVIV_02697 [Dictyocaulus viviparus]|uniref:Uncharacterized protein n=1 Tax=Dictyocaulus viviparus TaxID=29172 RepID=A0A0D8Y4L9_DICVI|nr:hypothetical protein DICVIV_02697 [Dictyocaulus viviparus]
MQKYRKRPTAFSRTRQFSIPGAATAPRRSPFVRPPSASRSQSSQFLNSSGQWVFSPRSSQWVWVEKRNHHHKRDMRVVRERCDACSLQMTFPVMMMAVQAAVLLLIIVAAAIACRRATSPPAMFIESAIADNEHRSFEELFPFDFF